MTLGDLSEARGRAESLMTSTARYFTPGPPSTDPNTGEVTSTEVGPHTTICRIRPATMRDYPAEVGGAQVFASNYVVSVPFGASPVPTVKQRVVVVSSPDAALIGAQLQIRDVAFGDGISARRMLCYKVT